VSDLGQRKEPREDRNLVGGRPEALAISAGFSNVGEIGLEIGRAALSGMKKPRK
jgi:hypothetical protein